MREIFILKLANSQQIRLGFEYNCRPAGRFRISQHERDKKLLNCLIKYLGKLYKYSGEKSAVVYTIFRFSDIINIIIPFFEQNRC